MVICMLLLAWYLPLSSGDQFVLLGEKAGGMHKSEYNWLTLAPPAVLIILMLVLGLSMPPQLNTLLNGATGVMTVGNTAFKTNNARLWQVGRV